MAIALYGATGYTGGLVTDELARRGGEFVLGGRNRDKLSRLAEKRGRGARHVVASVDDPGSLVADQGVSFEVDGAPGAARAEPAARV